MQGAPGEFSTELLKRMERLTPKQRLAIPQIVRWRGENRPWKGLFQGEERVCNEATFWRRDRGWWHQELFREVLTQAQREYDAAVLRTSVQDAAEGLRKAAPLATELLGVLIAVALRGLDENTPPAARKMVALTGDEKPSVMLRAADRLLAMGMKAALGVLDRADIETAVKGLGGADERFAALLAELRGLDGDG